MPISPERQLHYPGGSIRSREWREGYRAPILQRAGDRCEGTPQRPDCRVENGRPHPVTGAIVVLTVAHMDQGVVDHSEANLRALCQLCHNSWDALARARSAARTRARRLGEGTLDLFCDASAGPKAPPEPESRPEPEPPIPPKQPEQPTVSAERLKAKIAALRAKTMAAGCTEAEALAAAEAVVRLMAQHGLSEEELTTAEATFPERASRPNWRWDLAVAVASVTNTAFLWTDRSFVFIGRAPGPEIATYLQEVCVRAVERERKAFQDSKLYRARRRAATRRAATTDFTEGMVTRLRGRLRSLFWERIDAVAQAAAELSLARRYPDTRERGRSEREPRFPGATLHGHAAGDRTRLDHGVSSGAAPRRIEHRRSDA